MDISVFYEKEGEESAAKRQEQYRLLLAAFIAANIHIRKE